MAHIDTTSYWTASAQLPAYPALDRDLTVDVVVVGAGVTGLTAAYLLKRAGRTVAVVERERVGGVDSSRTTAHLTCVTDLDLSELIKNFGRDHAQAVWDAGLAAIDQLDAIVREEGIECDWTWVTGYKHASDQGDLAKETDHLREEAALASELGFDAQYTDEIPIFRHPGVAYAAQAKFHPRKYLAHLASVIDGDGSYVFEQTACEDVTDAPLSVKAGNFTVKGGYVVVATHTPLMGKTNLASATLLQTKLYLYTSYVIAGKLPKNTSPEGLFWDTGDPYNYLRVDRHIDHDFVIFGGEDHKTGQAADTNECFRRLEQRVRAVFPAIEITHRWSGQVIETNDGLPFIGEASAKQFVGTGVAGNGMTFGTLTAMMARDAVLGLKNPWSELLDVGRTKIKGGVWDYLKENVDYPYYMIKGLLAGSEGSSLRALGLGEGKVLELNGRKVAASRSDQGRLALVSATCTHMGCTVGWNPAERTWDCPCHGSRFKATGEVISGPAESPLHPVDSATAAEAAATR